MSQKWHPFIFAITLWNRVLFWQISAYSYLTEFATQLQKNCSPLLAGVFTVFYLHCVHKNKRSWLCFFCGLTVLVKHTCQSVHNHTSSTTFATSLAVSDKRVLYDDHIPAWLTIPYFTGLRSGLLEGHMSDVMNSGVLCRNSSTVSCARLVGALSCRKVYKKHISRWIRQTSRANSNYRLTARIWFPVCLTL